MSKISTHVLDAVRGMPAADIEVTLELRTDAGWQPVAGGSTDADGRCRSLAPDAPAGIYRLTFNTGAYLARQGRTSIYPEICIPFACSGEGDLHLPLLLSDNSYTTYRGS